MTIVENIKKGLQFSFRTISGKLDNSSFLKRHRDALSLTCQFLDSDSSTAGKDISTSYYIEYTFSNEYLNAFSFQDKGEIYQFPEYQEHDICYNTQMILHEIVNCKLEGVFRSMFLESKALALLLCFQKCYAESTIDCDSCKFLTKPVEKEKILKTKEIILSRLDNPPTIPELSLQIGINQCYLKKGFKELFGTTIYDFVQEQRMLKAKKLLSTTDYSVSQVADIIGFSSTSNFSSAFKKHAGIFPSELQKN